MFFKVEKASSLKGSLENPKWFFDGITVKQPFWNLYFFRVYKETEKQGGKCHLSSSDAGG